MSLEPINESLKPLKKAIRIVSTLGKIRFAEPRAGESVIPGVPAGTAARLSWPELIYRRLRGRQKERNQAP